jgi:hypothetical protein
MRDLSMAFTSMVLLLLFVLSSSLCGETLNGVEILSGEWKGQNVEYLDREILIGLKPGKTQALFEQEIVSFSVEIVRQADRFGFLKLKVGEGIDLFAVINAIDQLPTVEYAEPNMVDRMFVIPNDPMFSQQWHYHNIGQVPPGGTYDADIDAPEGWDISTGSDTIIVGVLDSGIPMQGGSLSHPDLDDPNRFLIGQDVISWDGEPLDDNGHGTHVSGTIGAETNNNEGVAGVAWNVKIMAIKVFSSSGSGSHEYFRDGCIYGVDNGCKVLNYSGGGSAGEAKEHGVAYADSNDVVLCAAAGNNWQGSVSWPGAYSVQYDNVICVSATDPYDQSSAFSSIGPEVTISAPGGSGSPYDADDIISTFPNYPCYLTTNYGLPLNYGPLAGTSMATPHVTGFAALILSMNPDLTPDSVRQIMMNTADDLGPAGFDYQFGYGRINVFNALSQMGPINISHTPLPDTKDTLNDYEALCTIWSVSDLVADSILLRYEIGSVWYEDTLTAAGGANQYHAYIPAQSPGTTINYYIFAQNEDGDADSTDTYSFYVIDYGVILEPASIITSAPVYDTVFNQMLVINNGIYSDEFSLALDGNLWETTIWDETQTSQITSTGIMNTDDTLDFYVRVIVPSSLEGEFDSVDVSATSVTSATISATSFIKTISAGQPWEIPFTDLFVTSTFDMTKWESTDGVQINDIGIGEPSAPYSANLNGDPSANDAIETEMINLRDETNVIVKYAYQQTGGGESPDAGDDLIIEYLDMDSVWNELNRHLGSEPDMTEFEEIELPLPAAALHAGFRLRIRCTATSGAYDDWFVDDVYVGHPSDYDVAVAPSFQSQYGPAGDSAVYGLTVINEGYLDDNFDLSHSGAWDVVFFNELGTVQITSTGVVSGGDSINIIVKVVVPPGTPLHETNQTTIHVTSQGDSQISSYALIETKSAGFPAAIPWYEIFPDDTLYTQRWFVFVGGTVSMAAAGTPSMPYSYNLDGGTDTAATQLIDLQGHSGALLSYYYERGGNADPPEVGEDLWVEYRSSSGAWINLITHPGNGEAMTEFEYVSLPLPTDAMHSSFQVRFRTSGSGAGSDDWYIDNVRVDYAPEMVTLPSSFSEILTQGESSEADLIISNSGLGGLLYTLDINPHLNMDLDAQTEPASRIHPEHVYIDNVAKGDDLDYQANPVEFSRGGPDDFGYYWIDSDEPGGPVFEWIDVSSTGIDLVNSLDDDTYSGPYDLGFDFPFYGNSYDQIFITSNGLIGFGEEGMKGRISRPIPDATDPNNFLAWFWDDLNPDDADNPGAHVYFKSGPDKCVIQFVDYPEYSAAPGDIITAEVIMRPDGTVRFQYLSIAPGLDILNCTVGIENQDGFDGLEVVYHASYLHDNLAIEFFKPYDWLLMDRFEGEIAGGETDTIHCQFVTDMDLEAGSYSSDIIIRSNDPDNDPWIIGAELEVLAFQTYICGDANNDETVNVSDATAIINYIFVPGSPEPDPLEAGDVNCDGTVNVTDAVCIINYIFVGGNAPCDTNGDDIPDC